MADTACRDCMTSCQLEDLKFSGCFFTWNNKQQNDERVCSKIDRAMVNSKWTDVFQESKATFFPEGIFDHSPIIISFYVDIQLGRKPFRYFRMWKEATAYKDRVSTSWRSPVYGTEMFKVVTKLKRLKQVLLEIDREGYQDLQKLDSERFSHLHKAYLTFLAQKAKAAWVLNGDENTQFFHASLNARRLQNRILSIKTETSTWVDTPEGVRDAFLGYYQRLLGTNMQQRRKVLQAIVNLGPVLNEEHKCILSTEFSTLEVKTALFSIPGMKAPGPDGFSSSFYQDNWQLVGQEDSVAIISFLSLGKLLKEINATSITLIPKTICPDTVGSMPRYKFHDRCASLKMNHLCFADDILLFSHGDYISILWMLKGLKLFSGSLGLLPNVTKSKIYCCGMNEKGTQRVLDVSGFTKSKLPFRYLGIPICSKKNSAAECGIILEKMMRKIRQWSTRNISYMGRVILINSVLMSIHAYWTQIMILLKKLLKDIVGICRAFLWKGRGVYSGPGLVAWNNICISKAAGGLGFRNVIDWNIVAMGKYVWATTAKKDNLWVKWVHSVYLSKKDWWSYRNPPDCSWYWRKLVVVKEFFTAKMDMASFIATKYTIGAGSEEMAKLAGTNKSICTVISVDYQGEEFEQNQKEFPHGCSYCINVSYLESEE
ncbi:uncharacterized protein LOC133832241 [Humulus lupulus]|uniref:uncharacterized protein LOC133832241 n=1 Tax=Humulus lupulus TaxID=3486 RepID=UPI002B40EB2D|nr:uncharacterized protein LOC133832241 [Humulus lupulus]